MVLKRMARGVKDGAVALALRAWVNDRYAEFGKVTDVSLDTERGTLRMVALLEGEREPITVTIDRFTLHEEDGETHLLIHSLSASRGWVAKLLQRLGTGRRIPLPAAMSKLL